VDHTYILRNMRSLCQAAFLQTGEIKAASQGTAAFTRVYAAEMFAKSKRSEEVSRTSGNFTFCSVKLRSWTSRFNRT